MGRGGGMHGTAQLSDAAPWSQTTELISATGMNGCSRPLQERGGENLGGRKKMREEVGGGVRGGGGERKAVKKGGKRE